MRRRRSGVAQTSPHGSARWTRIRAFFRAGSFGHGWVGENFVLSSPTLDATSPMQLWEHSPEHLANLLSLRWRQIGVSAVSETAAPGACHGMDVTIITTDFGTRRR